MLDARGAKPGQAVAVDRILPGEKLFNREHVAPAHVFQRNEPAVHGGEDLGNGLTLGLLAVLLPSAPSLAQVVYVIGADLDCSEWVDSRTKRKSLALEHYVLGFLNGLAMGNGVEFWRADGGILSSEGVYLWLDNYCQNQPLGLNVTWKARGYFRLGSYFRCSVDPIALKKSGGSEIESPRFPSSAFPPVPSNPHDKLRRRR